MSDRRTKPDGAALVALLIDLFPSSFNLDPLGAKPLKIGIHLDLVAGIMTKAETRSAMSAYCRQPRYLRCVQAGVARVDLCGHPCGVVAEHEEAHAKDLLIVSKERKPRAPTSKLRAEVAQSSKPSSRSISPAPTPRRQPSVPGRSILSLPMQRRA